ncbi:hypothetical protein RI129_002639 [Pyrocoelia pectoralis]|uniref:Uncharacterized protein n=1 Tax=Pyrocoelia pectoralis TaxID=417401 RepID=A0AAN7ZLP0_9COLE
MLANKRKTVPLISEISEETFESQVPDLLLLFSRDHIHALTLSNIIQSFCQKSCSNNLQIGLGLYLYNNVRSKKVIDLLHNMGVSCSYNDIRSLITSLAKNAVKTENHIYVPYGIQSVDQEKKNYIHSSIDNFDLNEETLSGKDTTHSMALVVFQEKLEDLDVDGKIPKESKYSLSMEDVDIPFQKIERYYNPNKRPEPDRLDNLQCSTTEHEYSRKVNFVWRFLRHLDKEKPFLGWTEYHDVLSTSSVKVAQIAYLPFLNNPPTDCDTIYTSMLRLVELAEHLNQHHIIITADLAIYSKAQEILWNKPARLDGKVTLQLGGMHLCLAFLASIGFLYKDSGLYDMLVETEIYAPNTCKQILEGKHYSRSIRSLILTSDALTRLLIDSFYEWMEKEPLDEEVLSHDILQDLKDGKFRKSALDTYLNALNPLFEKMKEFENIGSKSSPTFSYWLSFLDSVNLLLDYQSAERNGSFQLHLKCVFEMLPYLKAGGRHLYAKWVPIYLKDMNQLKLTQPEMYDYLERGNFVVKKTNEKTFNCVASDMALEQSINRDCKSSSGVVGFTRKPTALLRWMMTRHIVGSYSQNFEGV